MRLLQCLIALVLLSMLGAAHADEDAQYVADILKDMESWRILPDIMAKACAVEDPAGVADRERLVQAWRERNAGLIKDVNSRFAALAPFVYEATSRGVPAKGDQITPIIRRLLAARLAENFFGDKDAEQKTQMCRSFAAPSHALWAEKMQSLVRDDLADLERVRVGADGVARKIKYQWDAELRVTDDAGRPLAGAVVWFVNGAPRRGLGPNAASMARMLRRYAQQSDFVADGDIPEAYVARTSLQGVYRYSADALTAPPSMMNHYMAVAIKRGYVPQVIEGAMHADQLQVQTVKLQRDAQVLPDPLMETFDRLMAQAVAPVPGEDLVSEARMRRLDEVNPQVRALAQALEKEGRTMEASAVYWTLADFPEVIRSTTADGKLQIEGYRRGKSDQQSMADRMHAAQLNASVPKVRSWMAKRERPARYAGADQATRFQAVLKEFDELASGPDGERIMAEQYRDAITEAIILGTPDQACTRLQQAFRFEPTFLRIYEWWDKLDKIQEARAELKLPAQACVIADLPQIPAR